MSIKNKQIVLIVLDGWGYREDKTNNAIASAKTPVFDSLWKDYPHTLLEASGEAVGLPEGQMGNSEIGHTTIGAGAPIDTDLVRIDKSIKNGEFRKNSTFLALFDHVKKNNSTLHLCGLLSPGGIHCHQAHLFELMCAAKDAGLEKIAVHVFTDGRDTPPQSAAGYLKELEKTLADIGIGFIASVSGRFYAMDRDNNWDRLEKVEDVLFECKGNVCAIKPSEQIEKLYKDGKLDEHLEPMVCLDYDGKGCSIEDNDAVFFFNFRADRARMLSSKLIEKSHKQNICFGTLTDYGTDFKCLVAFPSKDITHTLAGEISKAGLTQAHIAETEKFPHATYFLNGGREKPYPGETHILLDSRKDVKTHDQAPKMRAEGIALKACEEIKKGTNFIFINFANPDMVGHTANVPAIIEAVEEVDYRLGIVLEALKKTGGIAIVTADHGNAELNIDPKTGDKHTSHTTNKVPLIAVGHIPHSVKTSYSARSVLNEATLADIAPTILSLFGLTRPKEMTGNVLFE